MCLRASYSRQDPSTFLPPLPPSSPPPFRLQKEQEISRCTDVTAAALPSTFHNRLLSHPVPFISVINAGTTTQNPYNRGMWLSSINTKKGALALFPAGILQISTNIPSVHTAIATDQPLVYSTVQYVAVLLCITASPQTRNSSFFYSTKPGIWASSFSWLFNWMVKKPFHEKSFKEKTRKKL